MSAWTAVGEVLGGAIAELVERAVGGDTIAQERLERVADILGTESASTIQRRLDEAAIDEKLPRSDR